MRKAVPDLGQTQQDDARNDESFQHGRTPDYLSGTSASVSALVSPPSAPGRETLY